MDRCCRRVSGRVLRAFFPRTAYGCWLRVWTRIALEGSAPAHPRANRSESEPNFYCIRVCRTACGAMDSLVAARIWAHIRRLPRLNRRNSARRRYFCGGATEKTLRSASYHGKPVTSWLLSASKKVERCVVEIFCRMLCGARTVRSIRTDRRQTGKMLQEIVARDPRGKAERLWPDPAVEANQLG